MSTGTHRLLGALLPAALLVATLTATASAATPGTDVPSLVNGSFEEEVVDGAVPGWHPLWPSSTTYYSLTQERASDGLTSVHITDTSTSGGGGLVAGAVPVEAGQEYVLSFDQYYRSGALNPTVYFDGADGNVITQPYRTVRSTADSWERVEVVVVAPEGAVQARPTLYTSVGGVVDVFVDDVTFVPHVAVPDQPTSPVNPGFEADLVGEVIPGWGVDGSVWDQQSYAVVDDVARSGTRSLWLRDDSTVRGLSIQSEPFAVEPGVVYDVTAQMRVERDQLGLYVRFFDAAGNRTTNAAVWQGETAGEWREARHTITSPDTAVTGTVVLNSSVGGRGIGHVDDVAVVAADEQPPGPVDPTDPATIVAQNDRITYLGTPVSSRIITNMVVGEEDGVSMTYGVYRGNKDTESPATLVVAETLTGEIVRTLHMPGADHATHIQRSTDGKIYMTTTGTYSLWVYNPETAEIREIGLINPASPADGYGWALAAAEDGRMYIGSYPKGLLYLYDPADDSITNLGRVDETQAYIRALAYDLDTGVLYVGAGGSSAQIWKVEPDGTKTALLSEERTPGAQDHSFISTFTLTGGKLFARGGLSELLVIDTETDEVEYWKGDGKEIFGYQVTERPDAPGTFIFTFGSTFWEYDSVTATTRDLGIPNNGYLNDAFWTQLDDPQWPGWTMVAATNDGVVKLNLETGTSEADDIDYRNPVIIQKLLTGPDSLYASGYMVGLASVGSEPGEFGETVQSGQFESSAVRDGRMLLGTYGHGRLMEYDPAAGSAPRQVFTLEAEKQDRPFGLDYDPVSDRAFMGTVPYYGHNQGALAVHDFTTGETAVYTEEIVEEQSVIDVLHHDGLVYLGTTIDGGLGGLPSGQTDAHFIVFDPDTGEVLHDVIPVAGDEGVTGLMVGPDGLIWGVSEDTVFKWDPQAEQIVYSEKVLGHRYGTNTVWAWAYLSIGADGDVYGTNRFSFFKIDAETMEYTRIVDRAGGYSNVDENGDVYFSSGVHVFKYDVPAAEVEPVEVTPADVTFADEPGTDEDSYTIPEVEGVEYLVDGDVVAAGSYPGTGSVGVSARAGHGYVLTEGATAEWSHTFADGGPEQPEDPGDLPALRAATDGFIVTGEIAGPIAHQLHNVLDQAERHLGGDRATPAVGALERYVAHLEDPKRPDTLSDVARVELTSRAERLIASLT